MPINYKRWDELVDSDEEEPAPAPKQQQPSAPPVAPPPMPTLLSAAASPSLGRAAVCSTMKDVRHRIESWVRWHLHIGFERLYIFFDDANETESAELAKAVGGSAVQALMRDSDVLKQAWRRQPSWGGMGKDADKDVQIRQLLNAQHSMDLARTGGLTWLLHLDSDELFLPRGASASSFSDALDAASPCAAGSVVAHFSRLAASGCECFVYHNFEAVPEGLPPAAEIPPTDAKPAAGGPTSDPFSQIELFKLAESRVPWREDHQALDALEAWRKRTRSHKFFLYYESGKCACRVDTDGNWVPVSVHTCLPRLPQNSDGTPAKWDEPRLNTRAWTNDYRNSGLRHAMEEGSCVLHYPVWDPAALWHKYVLHGDFTNELVSGKTHKKGLQWGECFHIECRDVYLKNKGEADGGYSALLELFKKVVMLQPNDRGEAERQIHLGLLVRLKQAKELLTARRGDAAATMTAAAQVSSGGGGGPQQQTPPAALLTPPAPPPPRPSGALIDPHSTPVWTAGYARRIRPYQAHGESALERLDWRGPKAWRAEKRLSGTQLEALRMMQAAKQ